VYRLDIGQADTHILSGTHGVDSNIKSPVTVLFGQGCFPAGLFFLLIYFTGLLLFEHFAGHRQAVDPVGKFTDCGFFRYRKGIDCLKICSMRIGEHLFNAGNCISVFDDDVDVMLPDLKLRQTRPCRGQQSGGAIWRAP